MIRRLAALAAVVAMVVVPPVLLVWFGFYDVRGLSPWTPGDVRLVLLILTVVGWAAWAAWVVSLLVEVAALLTPGRRGPRLPGLGATQAMAAWLLAAVVASSGAAVVAGPGAGLAAEMQASVRGLEDKARPAPKTATATPLAAESPPPQAVPSAQAPGAHRSLRHVVVAGDDLWSLAERFYGEGTAWRQIVAANPSLQDDPLADLPVGIELTIVDPVRLVTVRAGDTLSGLAKRYLGHGSRWPEIRALNRARIADPDLIDVGWLLRVPLVAEPVPSATPYVGTFPASRADAGQAGEAGGGQLAETVAAATGGSRQDGVSATGPGYAGSGNPRADAVVGPPSGPQRGVGAASDEGGGPSAATAGALPVDPSAVPTSPDATGSETISPDASGSETISPGAPGSETASPTDRGVPLPATPEGPGETAVLGGDSDTPAETSVPGAPGQAGEGAGALAVAPAAGSAGDRSAASDAPREMDARAVALLVGGLSALTAGAVLGGIALRRRLQEATRPLGRRYVQPGDDLRRIETALAARASEREPDLPVLDREDLVGRAMRHLSRVWCEAGAAAPPLERVVVGDVDVEFVFARDPGPTPEGFQVRDRRVAASWVRLSDLDDLPYPVAYPALVTLGAEPTGELVLVDLVTTGVLGVTGETEAAASALSAMVVELTCAPWASELGLLVVTDDPHFALAAAVESVTVTASVAEGVAHLERLARERGRFLAASGAYDRARLDPNLAEAWSPQVVLFESVPDADALARLAEVASGVPCGLAAVVPADAPRWSWKLDDPGGTAIQGTLAAAEPTAPRRRLAAQTIPRPAREAIAGLYALAQATASEPAPWWTQDGGTPDPEESDDVNIITLPPVLSGTAPLLRLIGPVVLERAAGDEPPRAARQCLEYCGWLLEHPGATAVQMGNALLVAEGTRRSNMSRLRSWLGADAAGRLYLPDAYSGRIHLHEDVTSDVELVRRLVLGGVDRASTERLVSVLELVRGAPLADAAPGQWHWAEELRSDIAALIRDAGVVLATRARAERNLDLARWAANRALAVAPDDELLVCERIRTEYAAGALDEVERLATRIHRTARVLGIDLLPETVDLLQEVMEGRLRARRA